MKDGSVDERNERETNETVVREALQVEIEEGQYEYDEAEEAVHAKGQRERGETVSTLAEQFADYPAEIISIREITFEEWESAWSKEERAEYTDEEFIEQFAATHDERQEAMWQRKKREAR